MIGERPPGELCDDAGVDRVCELSSDGDVFVLRWDDGGDNRLNPTSLGALNAALDTVEAIDGPAALVIVGAGKYWSNGLDLDWMGANRELAGGLLDDVHRLLVRLLLFPRVTVAAINGHAFAGGAMLAAACDLKVMRDDRGYWCLPEADLRMQLSEVMLAVIVARLPHTVAHQAIVTGRRYTAAEALAAGIVDAVAAEAEVLDRAIALARPMAAKHAVGGHKRMLHGAIAALLPAAARSDIEEV